MTPETAAALEASIRHWKENLKEATEGFSGDVDTSRRSCALCDRFFDFACEGCPIRERTGQPFCLGTPYPLACEKLDRLDRGPYSLEELIEDEIEFLESLREETS